MSQKRQPKGTDVGGQFAPDVNPESGAVLVEALSPTYHCDYCDAVSFEEVHDCGHTCREIDPVDAVDMGIRDEVKAPVNRALKVQGCLSCDAGDDRTPPHFASPRCESGGRQHCSCDKCY